MFHSGMPGLVPKSHAPVNRFFLRPESICCVAVRRPRRVSSSIQKHSGRFDYFGFEVKAEALPPPVFRDLISTCFRFT
jgi:hypothetical protein